MTQSLKLPIRFDPLFYPKEVARCIEEVCTPIERANPYEFVGVEMSFVVIKGIVKPLPITHLYSFEEEDDRDNLTAVSYHSLLPHEQKKCSHALMNILSEGFFPNAACAIDLLMKDKMEACEFSMITLHDAAIIIKKGYLRLLQISMIEHGKLTQDVIDQVVLAVYLGQPQTAHEMLEVRGDLLKVLGLVNRKSPMPSPDEFFTNTPLMLPDIGSIETLPF